MQYIIYIHDSQTNEQTDVHARPQEQTTPAARLAQQRPARLCVVTRGVPDANLLGVLYGYSTGRPGYSRRTLGVLKRHARQGVPDASGTGDAEQKARDDRLEVARHQDGPPAIWGQVG